MKSDQYKKVYEGKPVEANYIKSVLEENGISVILKDDMMSQVFPLYVASGELKPVRIYVDRDTYNDALKIIETYTNSGQ